MTTIARSITGGVDTHLDVHVAAALDERGALLGVESFRPRRSGLPSSCCAGSRASAPSSSSASKGPAATGPGSPGTFQPEVVAVVEVDRPNRQRRRRKGKSDPEDAVAAARAAQGGDATGSAKTRDGNVEAMRVLRVARSSARSSRTQAINQMRSLISTAPDELRAELRDLSIYKVLTVASAYRHTGRTDVADGHQADLAHAGPSGHRPRRRGQGDRPDAEDPCRRDRPELSAIDGVGTDVASALLVAAGDNPERLKNEATFAKLCGVSPLDASSGKQERHRLNRGGDRQANSRSGTSCSPGWSTTRGPSTTSSAG